MCKSLLRELRFKIGEQYELNEFNLKSLESTFSNGLEFDNYEYVKHDYKTLFGVEFSKNVILQYNGDILYGVIYEFKVEYYQFLFSKISTCSFKNIILEILVKDKNYCQIVMKKR